MPLIEFSQANIKTYNTYVSLQDAKDIISDSIVDTTKWDNISDTEKEKYIKKSTINISNKWKYKGRISYYDQALTFPRRDIEIDGRIIKYNEIPEDIKRATALYCLQLLEKTNIVNNITTVGGGDVISEKIGKTIQRNYKASEVLIDRDVMVNGLSDFIGVYLYKYIDKSINLFRG